MRSSIIILLFCLFTLCENIAGSPLKESEKGFSIYEENYNPTNSYYGDQSGSKYQGPYGNYYEDEPGGLNGIPYGTQYGGQYGIPDGSNPQLTGFGGMAPTNGPNIGEQPGQIYDHNFDFKPIFTNPKKCRVYQTDFVPFSSSYLPLIQGPLSNGVASYDKRTQRIVRKFKQNNQTKFENSSIASTPVLKRFDNAMMSVFKKKTGYQKEYLKSHFNNKSSGWEGFCNRWTASSQNRALNLFLDVVPAIACNDIVITRGEIEELFTSSYLYFSRDFKGKKNTRDKELWEKVIMGYTGRDDLSAHELDRLSQKYLSQNKAFGMDVDSSSQVWNHPIYKMERCTSKASSDSLSRVPADMLESDDDNTNIALSLISKVDEELAELSLKLHESKYERDLDTKYYEDYKKAALLLDINPPLVSGLGGIRTSIDLAKRNLISDGEIRLKKGYKVDHVTSKMEYKIEDLFSVDERTSKDFNTDVLKHHKDYSYLVITNPKGEKSSSWLTSANNRPDYFFHAAPGSIKLPLIKDLEQLLLNCSHLGNDKELKLVLFKKYFKQLLNDNKIDENEMVFLKIVASSTNEGSSKEVGEFLQTYKEQDNLKKSVEELEKHLKDP